MTKKLKCILLLMCSLLLTSNVFAETKFTFSSLGKFQLKSESLIFKSNRFYAPKDAILCIISANGTLNNEEKTFTILWHTNKIVFTLDWAYVLYNDKKIEIASAPFSNEGQFYVPISVIRDVFGGTVSYDKENDILDVKLNMDPFRKKITNPFDTINKINQVDSIDFFDTKNHKIIINKDELTLILNEYLNNNYTRVEFGDKRTMGYKYYLDLYCKDEKLVRIWVQNNKLISFSDDYGYYELETLLTYQF